MPLHATLPFDIPLWVPENEAEKSLLGALSSLADGAATADPGREVVIAVNGVLPASRLRSVCTSGFVADVLRGRRLLIVAAECAEPLDLSFVELRFPLSFERCRFGDIILHHARLAHLTFTACRIDSLDANGATVNGDLNLYERVRVRGKLSLQRACVRGSVRLSGARIYHPGRPALEADDLRVGGSVEMQRLLVLGKVTLYNARIRSNLLCRGARLFNPGDSAVAADLIRVEGAIFMRYLRTRGEISMVNADCRGDLILTGAVLRNEQGNAITLDHVRAGGSIYFRNTDVMGTVRIPGAEVGLDVYFTGSRIRAPRKTQAGASGALRATSGVPDEPPAIGAVRVRAHGNLYFTDLDCTGPVLLVGSRVGGFIRCRRASLRIRNPAPWEAAKGAACLDGRGTIIRGSVEISDTRTNALFDFRSARVSGNFQVSDVDLDPYGITGALLEHGAVGGEFCWVRTPGMLRTRLDLGHAQFGRVRHGRRSWPRRQGSLRLEGCGYQAVDFSEPALQPGPVSGGRRARSRLRAFVSGFFQLIWGSRSHNSDELRWLGLQKREPFASQTYEQLNRVKRRSGEEDEARQIAIAMERERSAHERSRGDSDPAACFIDRCNGALLDYGHSTRRVWVLSVAVVVLGAVLFGQADGAKVMTLVQEDVYLDSAYQRTGEDPDEYPKFSPAVYSLDAFLPVIDLHQEKYWLPNARRACVNRVLDRTVQDCGGWFRVYLWAHILVGWIATTLLLISVAGILRNPPPR